MHVQNGRKGHEFVKEHFQVCNVHLLLYWIVGMKFYFNKYPLAIIGEHAIIHLWSLMITQESHTPYCS